ncbi:glycerol-3-phosphate 1-O-acyltransferase PlsY [Terrihabitans rhizophilus]|uniref:glycerol-3-phosphate 1-O-acyltransferase PlsY n=1 Tax=Terrihabitans rhizophilus TaxID=3092662 RepID=UPI0029DE89B6|nr:glycerol-3-phosphate 1-O-acyltransferase PlsY [Terrihabitans sp. PJ23]
MADLSLPLLFAALAFGYVLGSVPFGWLLTRAAGLGDIRSIGSNNIGATNVLRTGRKDLAAATLLCDALKGTVAVLIAAMWGPEAAIAAALGAFIGHLFPVWLGFRGGKGVATFIGLLIAFSWPSAIAFAAIWLTTAWLTRFSSLSALVAAAATPLILWLGKPASVSVLFLILAVLIFVKHHANIRRLMAGTETKIGSKTRQTESV